MNKKFYILFLLLLSVGCQATPSLATPTIELPAFITATLPASSTPAPSLTPWPATPAPTFSPITGTTTSEVNIREETSTASLAISSIPAFSTVQIMAQDSSGLWLQVTYNGNTGWVRADLVQTEKSSAGLPIWAAESGHSSGIRGVVLRGLNIRSGPGTEFPSLGLMNQSDVVSIFGKDATGVWLQVAYPPAPNGVGWVSADYMDVKNSESLAVILQSEPQAPSVQQPPVPGETLENDSQNSPLMTFALANSNYTMVLFEGQISLEKNDPEDWLEFRSQEAQIVIQVLCKSGGVQVELLSESKVVNSLLSCPSEISAHVVPDTQYFLRIWPSPSNEDGIYILKIESIQQ